MNFVTFLNACLENFLSIKTEYENGKRTRTEFGEKQNEKQNEEDEKRQTWSFSHFVLTALFADTHFIS